MFTLHKVRKNVVQFCKQAKSISSTTKLCNFASLHVFEISIEISRKFSSRFLKLSNNFYDLLRFLLVDRFKRPRAISLCI
ncbi:hypothetical protein T4D_6115 [Trichinella pseudospiralis]|uniref:Uncharacterized protein n=1 Tax=Trichinella pseudospiralis TaxID=6337 RepID=A0A0V1F8G3_TRIPS|nr:hypothetical protein T4D_6115 [Trichinella pseudospiralis]